MSDFDDFLACAWFDLHRDKTFTSSNPLAQQRKLLEETGEFVEAVLSGDYENSPMEAGDVALILIDMLHVMGSPYTLAQCCQMSLNKLKDRWPLPPPLGDER